VIVTEALVLRVLNIIKVPSAPGPSQITGRVLWQLADKDSSILTSITSIVEVLVNCLCTDPRAHSLLTAGLATLINKRSAFDSTSAPGSDHAESLSPADILRELFCRNDDPARQSRPRTINCGESLLKLAGIVALQCLADDAIPTAVGPVQLGVGVKGGTSIGSMRFQLFLDQFSDQPDMIALLIDISDAFMRANRGKMLLALFSHPSLSATWRLFRWHISQSNPRFLRLSDGEVFHFLQQEGGPQGDPLMPLMFSLLMSALLDRVLLDHPVLAAAYLDDTTLGGKVGVVRVIFEEMVRLAPSMCGFDINHLKTIALSVHPQPSPAVLEFVKLYNLEFHHGSTGLLGAIIGTDAERMSDWLLDKVRKHGKLFDVLSHPHLDPHFAHRLLRQVMLPKMTHLLRALPPAITEKATALFDEAVLLTYAHIGDSPDLMFPSSAPAIANISTKVAYAGSGLEPTHSTRMYASYAGFAAAAKDLTTYTVPQLDHIALSAAAVDRNPRYNPALSARYRDRGSHPDCPGCRADELGKEAEEDVTMHSGTSPPVHIDSPRLSAPTIFCSRHLPLPSPSPPPPVTSKRKPSADDPDLSAFLSPSARPPDTGDPHGGGTTFAAAASASAAVPTATTAAAVAANVGRPNV
jgi:hypothetical protein